MKTKMKVGIGIGVAVILIVAVLASNTTFFQGALKTGQFKKDNKSASHPAQVRLSPITFLNGRPGTSTLTLNINVNNSRGGTLRASDIPLYILRNGVRTAFTPNSTRRVAAGSYFAYFSYRPANYESSNWAGDCNAEGLVTVNERDNKTCSVTFTYLPTISPAPTPGRPTLTVIKTVDNSAGGTLNLWSFSLAVNGTSVISGVRNTFEPGRYTVTERTVINYMASPWGGDCAADGTINLARGDNKVCSITNTYAPPPVATSSLTLVKNVNNTGGGTRYFREFPLFINGSSVTSGVRYTLPRSGIYRASEETFDNYFPSGWRGDCSADGTVRVNPGDDKVCDITNTFIAPSSTTIIPSIMATGTTTDSQVIAGTTNVVFSTYEVRNDSNEGARISNFRIDNDGDDIDGVVAVGVYDESGSLRSDLAPVMPYHVVLSGRITLPAHTAIRLSIKGNTLWSSNMTRAHLRISTISFEGRGRTGLSASTLTDQSKLILPTKLNFSWQSPSGGSTLFTGSGMEVARFIMGADIANVNNPGASLIVENLNLTNLSTANLSNITLYDITNGSTSGSGVIRDGSLILSTWGLGRFYQGQTLTFKILADVCTTGPMQLAQFRFNSGERTLRVAGGSAQWLVSKIISLGLPPFLRVFQTLLAGGVSSSSSTALVSPSISGCSS